MWVRMISLFNTSCSYNNLCGLTVEAFKHCFISSRFILSLFNVCNFMQNYFVCLLVRTLVSRFTRRGFLSSPKTLFHPIDGTESGTPSTYYNDYRLYVDLRNRKAINKLIYFQPSSLVPPHFIFSENYKRL